MIRTERVPSQARDVSLEAVVVALHDAGQDASVEDAKEVQHRLTSGKPAEGCQNLDNDLSAAITLVCADGTWRAGRNVAPDVYVKKMRGHVPRWAVSEVRSDGNAHVVGEIVEDRTRYLPRALQNGTGHGLGHVAKSSLREAALVLATAERRYDCDFSTFSPAKRALIEDAKRAGYSVRRDDYQVAIVRRHKGNGRVLQGIVLYQDGTAIRADVDLSVATGMRSDADMRAVLSLPPRQMKASASKPLPTAVNAPEF